MYVEKIESAATRVYAMIDGVLMYSSLDTEIVSAENIDLNKIIATIQSDLELLIAEKDATINYKDLPSIEGSPILIYQLFYNLINNSLKFAKKDVPPLIEIYNNSAAADLRHDLHASGEIYVRIIVKDNGIGFNNDEANIIFKTFSRLNPKDKYEGTGLGLALCKKIVERHGGSISTQGDENVGATFEIILPVKQSSNDHHIRTMRKIN